MHECHNCHRKVWHIGRRCSKCQAEYRARRADRLADKGVKPRPAKVRAGDNPIHREWIRSLPCCVPGCREPSVCAHVRQNSGGGMGMKPHDRWTVPLCDKHHKEQHAVSHKAFDTAHHLDLRALAIRLAAKSPHIEKERQE